MGSAKERRVKKKVPIIRAEKAFEFKHTVADPWHPGAIIPGTQLDRLVGLKRTRISVMRVPPHTDATLFHSHHCEEEWLYVLQGHGVLDIEDVEHVLGPGDFAGFPAPSVGHQLRNPHEKTLLCLLGGERADVDVADFPKLGKRMYRRGANMEIYDVTDAEEIAPANLDELLTDDYRRSLKDN